jgi:hypothetical protein
VAELAIAGRRASWADELALAVKALERRKTEAEQLVRELIKPVETVPEGAENGPLQYTNTTLRDYPYQDTVIAR